MTIFIKNLIKNFSINITQNKLTQGLLQSNLLLKFRNHKKSFFVILCCSLVIAYFILYAIFGPRGIVDYLALKQELNKKSLIKNELSIKIKNQQNLVDRIQNESLDLDLLDEQVRKNLGYAKNNEIIIYNDDKTENE